MMTAASVRYYSAKTGPVGRLVVDPKTGQITGRIVAPNSNESRGEAFDPSAEIDRRARALVDSKACPSYSAAVHRVLQDDASLRLSYGVATNPQVARAYEQRQTSRLTGSVTDPSSDIDREARVHMERSGEKSYASAIRHVLRTDSHLAARYVGWSRRTA
jgi:hypothetical protein